MPTIRIDDEVYRFLQDKAVPFADTPNDVLRRELRIGSPEKGQIQETQRSRVSRVPRGVSTPRRAFERPIVMALRERGGSMQAGDALKAVEQRMRASFTPRDQEELPTGGERWRKNANFARLNLVSAGYLSRESQHGLWELTEKGRVELPQ